MFGVLQNAQVINGIEFGPGSKIWFDELGNLKKALFPRDQKVGKYLVKGTPANQMISTSVSQNLAGPFITFYSQGPIESLVLAAPQTIDGILFSDQGHIHFYPDGKVKEGILDEDSVLQDIRFRKDFSLGLFEDGLISFGSLLGDQMIQGPLFKDFTQIQFHPEGSIKSGVLGQTTHYRGKEMASGHISLNQWGDMQ